MNEQEAIALYRELSAILARIAPWAAEQIEDTVRGGKSVAKQVRRTRGVTEEVALLPALPTKLRANQFAATEELTPAERVGVALAALRRLIIDPQEIESSVRGTFSDAKVDDIHFAEPSDETPAPIHVVRLTSAQQERLLGLFKAVEGEVDSVRER